MTYPTFDNDMTDIVLEINDREIYNDIRSEIEVTETESILDADEEYTIRSVVHEIYLAANETRESLFEIPSTDRASAVWLTIACTSATGLILGGTESQCDLLDGQYYPPGGEGPQYHSRCYYGSISDIEVTVLSQTTYSMNVSITNHVNAGMGVVIRARYRFQSSDAVYHDDTNTRTLQVRAIDADSIRKYGRRVLPLTWPLGQSEEQMQALIDAYLERYKEPVPLLNMHIQGRTDALIVQILTREISDRITVKNTELGLVSADFFINSINANHDYLGLLECDWKLEQVRDMEASSFFVLDTSELDGSDILAW